MLRENVGYRAHPASWARLAETGSDPKWSRRKVCRSQAAVRSKVQDNQRSSAWEHLELVRRRKVEL